MSNNEKKRNIRFHFDMWHGSIYLEKSIPLLDKDDRDDFSNFINSKTSFNPHNMFICKSKELLVSYYNNLKNSFVKNVYMFFAKINSTIQQDIFVVQHFSDKKNAYLVFDSTLLS